MPLAKKHGQHRPAVGMPKQRTQSAVNVGEIYNSVSLALSIKEILSGYSEVKAGSAESE